MAKTKTDEPAFIPLNFVEYTPQEMLDRSEAFRTDMNRRRTIRTFSDRPVDKQILINAIMTASSAPSGAHKQPWTFALISDPVVKTKIREAAEKEEFENYHGRMSDEWLEDLAQFGTDEHKPFLETAPYLIVVFKKSYDLIDGQKKKNYYVQESVGLAAGFLLAALHHAGLATLTHTPSPMNFLQKVLERPENEKPFLLIPVGYPAAGTEVPNIDRKLESEVIIDI